MIENRQYPGTPLFSHVQMYVWQTSLETQNLKSCQFYSLEIKDRTFIYVVTPLQFWNYKRNMENPVKLPLLEKFLKIKFSADLYIFFVQGEIFFLPIKMIHIAGIKLKMIKQIDNANHDLHAKNQVNWVINKDFRPLYRVNR